EESAYAYALHAAMLVGPIQENHAAAYAFGLLAMRLNERLPAPALRAKILMMFAWAISVWRMPIETSIPYTREAFRLATETGLFVDAAWALFNETWFVLLSGRDLAALEPHAEYIAYIRRVKMGHIADAEQVILQWGRALAGLTESPRSLTGQAFDEGTYQATYLGQRLFEMLYLVAKLGLLCTFGEWPEALEVAERAATVIRRDFGGTIWDEIRVFYHAIALAALAPDTPDAVRLREVEALNARLARWARAAPDLFRRQHLIVSAEEARLRGQEAEAIALYEQAVGAALTAACPRERALASEVYARFRRGRGEEQAAATLLVAARNAYAEWGAQAKVRDLERRHPDLLAGSTRDHTAGPLRAGRAAAVRGIQAGALGGSLDSVTIMKAARAVAGEIE